MGRVWAVAGILAAAAAFAGQQNETLFAIGTPDNRAAEFGLTGDGEGYQAYLRKFPNPVVYTIGKSTPKDWPYIHPAVKDKWAGGRAHTFTIRFASQADEPRPLFLILGLCGGSPSERSKVVVTVNGADLPPQVAPSGDPHVCFNPADHGRAETMLFEIPPGRIRKGDNTLAIRLDEQSWILYDYVALSTERKPLPLAPPDVPDLLTDFRKGHMAGVEEIVFAARALGDDSPRHAGAPTATAESSAASTWPRERSPSSSKMRGAASETPASTTMATRSSSPTARAMASTITSTPSGPTARGCGNSPMGHTTTWSRPGSPTAASSSSPPAPDAA